MPKWLPVVSQLSTVAILVAAVLSASVALHVFRANRSQQSRKALHEGFDGFWRGDTEQTMTVLFTALPMEIINDKALQVIALEFFLQFQRLASSVSANADDWSATLDQHRYSRLRALMKHCMLLFEIVRHTSYPMERHAWNGTRRHAFNALLKAMQMQVRLPSSKLHLE